MLPPIFKKLNFKEEEKIAILHAPDSFAAESEAMKAITVVESGLTEGMTYHFVLAFVEQEADLLALIPRLEGIFVKNDPLLWIAYPKKSSKKYTSDMSRDSDAWLGVGEMGFEGVRQVAIDADWSALRFRQVAFIKQMKRKTLRAMSEEGKKRTE
ncbi:MAG: hypothetical protein AAFV07_01640 [Bacteroidota bacterium]